MLHLVNWLGKRAWKIVLSPKTVVVFKAAGLALQAFHEVENYRNVQHKGHKMGFRVENE